MQMFTIDEKSDSRTMDGRVAAEHKLPFDCKISLDRNIYVSGYAGEEELWVLIHEDKSYGGGCSIGNIDDIGYYYQSITKDGVAANKFFCITQLLSNVYTAQELSLPQKALMKM
jgi:hypothetical protein